jgi:hypothetical protein
VRKLLLMSETTDVWVNFYAPELEGRGHREINSTTTKEGAAITTNTIYNNGRPITQNISIHDSEGRVHTENVFWKAASLEAVTEPSPRQ